MNFIRNLFKRYQSVISYVFFGVLTTLINIVVFDWLRLYMYYQVANVIAWFASVLFAFITNKAWVFDSKSLKLGVVVREAISFFIFRGFSLLIDMLIMWVGISLMNGNPLLVKIIDNVVVVILNYFFSKWFIFRKS